MVLPVLSTTGKATEREATGLHLRIKVTEHGSVQPVSVNTHRRLRSTSEPACHCVHTSHIIQRIEHGSGIQESPFSKVLTGNYVTHSFWKVLDRKLHFSLSPNSADISTADMPTTCSHHQVSFLSQGSNHLTETVQIKKDHVFQNQNQRLRTWLGQ